MNLKCIRINELTESVLDDKSVTKYLLEDEVIQDRYLKKHDEGFIIKKSPNRIKVNCPIFYKCGGCDFLHTNMSYQLNTKKEYAKNLFLPFYENDIRINESPEIFNYRHKIVASATNDKLNKLKLGLYQEGSKHVIPFLDCLIQDDEGNKILAGIEKIFNKYKIAAYDDFRKFGIVKHVLIRKSFHTKEFMVVIVTQSTLLPNNKLIVKDILSIDKNIKTIIQNINDKNTSTVLLEKEKILFGTGYIYDEIDGIRYRLSSKSFYQINPYQMLNLYDKAVKIGGITKNDVVIDAYSGIGTISLLLAKQAKEVIAIEVNKSSHDDAMYNKKLNKVDNVTFINGDVSDVMDRITQKIDFIVMDPARDGASAKFLESVIRLKPKKIIYISCDIKTQVRDLKVLSNDYKVMNVELFDMFPQTSHVESVTMLEMK